MKNNNKIGALLAVVGIVTGLIFLYTIAGQYNLVMNAKIAAGRMDEATSVKIVYPVLGWLGVAASGVWAAALYGFLKNQRWAWIAGVMAASFQLLGGFFPAIPAMDSQLPTPTLIVFVLAAILWFGMMVIGGVKAWVVSVAFIAGIAFVLTYMDGVAPISKFTTSHDNPFWNGMYMMTQQIAWMGAWAWAAFIFALVAKKRWVIPIGIFAAVLSMIAGYPLGINNALFEVKRFSLFLPAPLISTALLVYLLLPGTQKKLDQWVKSDGENAAAVP